MANKIVSGRASFSKENGHSKINFNWAGYYRGRGGLEERVSKEELKEGLLISSDCPGKTKGTKKYSFIPGSNASVKLHYHLQHCPFDEKTMYEVIEKHIWRKFYLDIDIEEGKNCKSKNFNLKYADGIRDQLIEETINVLEGEGIETIPERDIAIMSSHSPTKFSYHVVFNNKFYPNHETCQAIFDKIVTEGHFEEEVKEGIIDRKVYSSLQNWRLSGCHKREKKVEKTFCERWNYYHEEIVHWTVDLKTLPDKLRKLRQFQDTLLSMTPGDSEDKKELEAFQGVIKEKREKKRHYTEGDFGGDFEGALNLVKENFPGLLMIYEPIVKDNYIRMKRKISHFCDLCKRVHDHENANITIRNGDIFFFCWRNEKPRHLGRLKEEVKEDRSSSKDNEGEEKEELQDVKTGPRSLMFLAEREGKDFFQKASAELSLDEKKKSPKKESASLDLPKDKKEDKKESEGIKKEERKNFSKGTDKLPHQYPPFKEPLFTHYEGKGQKYVEDIKHGIEYNWKFYPLKTYGLSAPMGSGKTFAILKDIERGRYRRILYLSPRQFFSKSLQGILDRLGFVSYLDRKKKRSRLHEIDRLIIQPESLAHFDNKFFESYDLVIIDESESIFKQFSSKETMKENWGKCCKVFEEIVKNGKFVIACDAFLSEKTETDLRNIRHPGVPAGGEKWERRLAYLRDGMCLIKSLCPPIKRKAYVYDSAGIWRDALVDCLRRGEKIISVWGSKTQMNDFVDKHLKKIFPNWERGRDFFVYDKETGDDEREKLINVNETWGDPRVRFVAYTSTVTVGIDFNHDDERSFDRFFLYGSANGACVRDLMQGTMRARYLRQGEVHAYVDNRYRGYDAYHIKFKFEEVEERLKKIVHDREAFDYEHNLGHDLWSYKCNVFDMELEDMTISFDSKGRQIISNVVEVKINPEEKEIPWDKSWAFTNEVYNVMEDNISKKTSKMTLWKYFHWLRYDLFHYEGEDDGPGETGDEYDYHAIEVIDEETKDFYEADKKSFLTKKKKLEIARWYFDSVFGGPEEVRQEHFNKWMNNKKIYQNVRLEKQSREFDGGVSLLRAHDKDLQYEIPYRSHSLAPKEYWVCKLTRACGMENSCSKTVLTYDQMIKLYKELKDDIPKFQEVFGYKRPTGYKDRMEWREMQALLFHVFAEWSSNKVRKGERDQKRRNGKVVDVAPVYIIGNDLYEYMKE